MSDGQHGKAAGGQVTVPMKALTIHQPWATCIAEGWKLVENRPQPFHYRGPLAIHAGLRWAEVIPPLVRRYWPWPTWDAPAGAVIAVAELVDCHRAAGCCKPWGEDAYDRAVYHLVLEDVRKLDKPVPVRGRQGLWNIDLTEAIR